MKEKIYTIPVTEAFGEVCECPMCTLEGKLENEAIDYYLGPSLMEPVHRVETNDKGFCRRHFEQLYNRQENKLGLGLIIDTHLQEQNAWMKDLASRYSSKKPQAGRLVERLIAELACLEKKCAVCSWLDFTMDRYIDVILYLWFQEEEFRSKFNSGKGFCLRHFRQLLEGVKKYLGTREAGVFVPNLLELQLRNMERVQQEVNWFTRKFDYRNKDAPWGNSKDALQRSIQKIVGYCDMK